MLDTKIAEKALKGLEIIYASELNNYDFNDVLENDEVEFFATYKSEKVFFTEDEETLSYKGICKDGILLIYFEEIDNIEYYNTDDDDCITMSFNEELQWAIDKELYELV